MVGRLRAAPRLQLHRQEWPGQRKAGPVHEAPPTSCKYRLCLHSLRYSAGSPSELRFPCNFVLFVFRPQEVSHTVDIGPGLSLVLLAADQETLLQGDWSRLSHATVFVAINKPSGHGQPLVILLVLSDGGCGRYSVSQVPLISAP
jgi:hypothetical protein